MALFPDPTGPRSTINTGLGASIDNLAPLVQYNKKKWPVYRVGNHHSIEKAILEACVQPQTVRLQAVFGICERSVLNGSTLDTSNDLTSAASGR